MYTKFFRSKALVLIVCMVFSFATVLSGCKRSLLNPDKPVTITMWHNYGGQMKILMDDLVSEFNRTVGEEEGIIVSVTAIAGSKELHEMLVSSAEKQPGALALPDLTTAYPKTAVLLEQKNLLCDFKEYFSKSELEAYVEDFVAEGYLGDEKLYVFPIAKSTELLFVNRTIFDRFASACGFSIDDLGTFEGISHAATAYFEWTDAMTPDIEGDGKAFFMADSLFNQALVGSRQLGSDFLFETDEPNTFELDTRSEAFSQIWDAYFNSAAQGGIAVFDGYSSDLFKTGDLVCAVGSTAGVLYYPTEVTYSDNTQEAVDYSYLPYPVFEGGDKIALQRGGGMCITAQSAANRLAASIFVKWFTAPEQNLRFTLSSGYLPVTSEAFEELFETDLSSLTGKPVSEQLETILYMYEEYQFFFAPYSENYDALQKNFETTLRKEVSSVRDQISNQSGSDTDQSFSGFSDDVLRQLQEGEN
ncbi:MAG: extracellular solute-binding protein [Clostridiaceae bacterium]|nr:extracellular solute-binding protein [Clostridiaceae bacterium]